MAGAHITHTFPEYGSRSLANLGWSLNDPRLDQLEKLNEQGGAPLFTLGRKSIRAAQFVGLVRLGDTSLQILPKVAYRGDFDRPENSPEFQEAVRSAMRNLLVMLSVACDLPLRAQDAAHLHTESGDWLEILTRIFALELHRQLKAGVQHAYISVEDRLPAIRGRWLVGQQMARRPLDRTRFDVVYDEFSPDTPLNRIFILTAATLRRLTLDPANRRLLLDLEAWLEGCQPQPGGLERDLGAVHFSRLNERFRPAFNLASLFWQQRLVQLSGGALPAFAFVFDMNRLFEDFIARSLQRYQERILPRAWQGAAVVLQSSGQKVYLAERLDSGRQSGPPVFRLAPDILLLAPSGEPYLIADTKYKRLNPQAADGGVSEADVYQMLAYAQRWNCPQALLLYPATGREARRFTLQVQRAGGASIRATTIDLEQPLDQPDGLVAELQQAFAPGW